MKKKHCKSQCSVCLPLLALMPRANEHHHETMSEAQPQVISATGVVKGIDLESKKITIHHDPIAAVNWPEMTMRFTITPQTKMSEIKNRRQSGV